MVFQVNDTPNKRTEKDSAVVPGGGGQGWDEGGPKVQTSYE